MFAFFENRVRPTFADAEALVDTAARDERRSAALPEPNTGDEPPSAKA